MRIAMLAPGIGAHDALSNDALNMTRLLRADGHELGVFAQHAHGVAEPVRPVDELRGWLRDANDIVMYHLATGWEFALDLLRRTPARRIVRHHNITPPEFFDGWSPGYVDACTRGRAELDAVAALRCELYLGASPFNVADFTARGVDAARCATLPPLHEIAALQAAAPDARRIPAGSPLLLMVGRIAPNKGHLDLVDVLAACIADAAPEAHLLLIGKLDPNLASYGAALHERIRERGLASRVSVLHDADGAELRAAYERADVLLMPSRHEGFCVPLVEAMALGTPVIALASSAIPWTLGDAGLLWEAVDPYVMAASVARLRDDAALRATLVERGRRRYADTFAPAVLARGLRDVIAGLAPR